MIDARVDDAVKQHHQKMDWLRGEEEAKSLTPPPAGGTSSGGKMGFNLPLNEAPQAQGVIAPVLEINAKQEGINFSAGGRDAGHDCKDGATAEAETTAENLGQPGASSDSEGKMREDQTGSSPPKDGTPVWVRFSKWCCLNRRF